MPAESVYKGDQSQVGYGVERVEDYDMATATATVTATTLTDTALAFGANDRLKGQFLVFTSGVAIDKQYLITGNDADTITCDGADFVTDGVTDEDRFYVTTYGIKPAATATWLGLIPQLPEWEPEIDTREYHSVGGGRDPVLTAQGVKRIERSFDVVIQSAGILGFALGGEASVGSSPASSTTLSAAAKAGHKSITLTSTVGYTNGVKVQVSAGTDPTGANPSEVRTQVGAPVGSVITLDAPLNFDHANAQAVAVVVAPYTHYFAGNVRVPSFTLEHVLKAPTNFVRHVRGVKVKDLTLMCEAEGELKATLAVIGKDIAKALAAASTITKDASTRPFFFKDGVFTYNGATIARVEKWQYKLTSDSKGEPYVSNITDGSIFEVVEGKRNHELSFTAAVINSTLFDLLLAGTAVSAVMTFSRGASDTLTITVAGVRLKKSAHGTPESGKVPVESLGPATSVTFQVVDSTPYYL